MNSVVQAQMALCGDQISDHNLWLVSRWQCTGYDDGPKSRLNGASGGSNACPGDAYSSFFLNTSNSTSTLHTLKRRICWRRRCMRCMFLLKMVLPAIGYFLASATCQAKMADILRDRLQGKRAKLNGGPERWWNGHQGSCKSWWAHDHVSKCMHSLLRCVTPYL